MKTVTKYLNGAIVKTKNKRVCFLKTDKGILLSIRELTDSKLVCVSSNHTRGISENNIHLKEETFADLMVAFQAYHENDVN